MSNEQLVMSKGKMPPSLLIFICSLLFALCSLLILACPSPFSPPNTEAPWENHPEAPPLGKGSFSLSLSVAARTIMPKNAPEEEYFLMYRLDFAVASESPTGAALGTDRSPTDLAAPVYLVEGIYDLKVTAYYDEEKTNPAARGSLPGIVITADKNTTKAVILKTIINEVGTEGTFDYPVKLPPVEEMETATMVITPDGQTEALHTIDLLTSNPKTLTLPTGYYDVLFTLLKKDNTGLVRYEVLQVYSGLISVYDHDFTTDNQFSNMIYTVTFMNEGTVYSTLTKVRHGATVSAPATEPTKTNYTFVGWYIDVNGSVYNFDTPVTGNITLYAKWTPNTIALPLTSVEQIELYLAQPNESTGTLESPVYLSFMLDLGTMTNADSNWQKMLTELNAAEKFVELDLAECEMSGGPSGAPQFNPVGSVATGKNRIVSITLPTVAVSIPDVTNYPTEAPSFNNFTNLKSFSGTGLKTIGNYAFYNNKSLTMTELPLGITSIGVMTFTGCTNLALTKLPNGITSIGGSAFSGCTNLALTSLPDGILSIGDNAFLGCTSLATISWPSSVTNKTISTDAFSGCSNLTTINLPDGLTAINGSAFNGCTKLALTSLPEGLTSIGDAAFSGCTSLALTSLPASLASIGDSAFSGCTNLTLVTCLRTTPPSAGTTIFGAIDSIANLRIKVPADPSTSLAAYKTTGGWSTYKDRIFAGSGAEGDPFLIYDQDDLRKVGQNAFGGIWTLDAHYRMITDITLTGTWTPIGTNTARFSGIFDGAGYSISNLTIATTDYTESQSMFGVIGTTAIVQNLALLNVSINAAGAGSSGGVVGENGGTVKDCYVTGNITSGSGWIGGVVGNNAGTVQNCYTTVNISSNYSGPNASGNIGGVVGMNTMSCTVINCYATGNIISTGIGSVGGVVGTNWGTLHNCVALNANITFTGDDFGRIFGKDGQFAVINNNYARNDMKKDGEASVWSYKGASAKDGADITSTQWGLESWWSSTTNGPGFDLTASGAWEWSDTNNLPILRGFTGTQNPTVEIFNTGFITITVEQITDGAASINIASTTISRSGTVHPKTVDLIVEAPAGTYTSIKWSINCVGIYKDQTIIGTDPTFIVNASEIKYNSLGGHTVYLVVVKDGVTYNKTITVTIVE